MSTYKITIGFSTITHSTIDFNPANIVKGKELNRSDHIFNVMETHRAGFPTNITGKCVPEMSIRSVPYDITIIIDTSRKVISAKCSCKAGSGGQCKHTSGLIFYVNSERDESKTDQDQTFNRPSRKSEILYPKGEETEKIFNIPVSEKRQKKLL